MASSSDQVVSVPDGDTALVRAFLDGDVDAFDRLYERHYPGLVAYLTRRLQDRAAAEDVAQETMIRAMRAFARFDCERPLRPWLLSIASNAAVDVMRSRGRAAALTTALSNQPVVEPSAGDIGERDVLRQALDQVPARQRKALVRCYVEGWRPIDVAPEFGVGSNAFEQLLHRARGNLRRAYLRLDGTERVAGVAWAALLTTRANGILTRLRRIELLTPSVGQAVASGVIAASIAVTAALPPSPSATPAGPEEAPGVAVVQVAPPAIQGPPAVSFPAAVEVAQDRAALAERRAVTGGAAPNPVDTGPAPDTTRPAPVAVEDQSVGPEDPVVGAPVQNPGLPSPEDPSTLPSLAPPALVVDDPAPLTPGAGQGGGAPGTGPVMTDSAPPADASPQGAPADASPEGAPADASPEAASGALVEGTGGCASVAREAACEAADQLRSASDLVD